jgi:hypothetical protein
VKMSVNARCIGILDLEKIQFLVVGNLGFNEGFKSFKIPC